MKKSDIERMISLADGRYIDEIFTDRLTGRRKNIALSFAAVAAALAIVAGGIGYLVSTAGDADKIVADDTIISETAAVDYSVYFQNYDEAAFKADDWDSWVLDTTILCQFNDSEYVKSVMPFSLEGYRYASCHFFYDYNDEVKYISIEAGDDGFGILAAKSGELFSHITLDRCKSAERFGVDVYGFSFKESDTGTGVVFEKDGIEYMISGKNADFDEIGTVMDSIIENGLWTDRFDISKAEMKYLPINAEISPEEANGIEPFAGHVPKMRQLSDMTLNNGKVSYYADRDENNDNMPKWLYLTYFNGTDKDISLQYFTKAAEEADEIPPLENTVSADAVEFDKLYEFKDGNSHNFTIDYGDFKINVWANNCSNQELQECITAIMIGADGVESYSDGTLPNVLLSNGITLVDSTLAKANKISPYEGYVPQSERFESLKLSTVSEGYREGISTPVMLHMVYVDDLSDPKQMMTAHFYTNAKDVFLEEPNVSAVPLSELSSENIGEYKTASGTSFIIDCGDFKILFGASSDCSTAEIEQIISEIKGTAGTPIPNITLEEARAVKPYAKYIPLSMKIGDIPLLSVSYDGENGENNILVSYVQDAPYKYIQLYYDTFRKGVEPVPFADVCVILDSLAEPSTAKNGGADSRHYDFAIDCNEFIIKVSADCSPEEIGQVVGEITSVPIGDRTPITLAEARNIEPFAAFVPERESGSMKLENGELKKYDGKPVSLHFTFSDGTNRLVIAYGPNDETVHIPDENIIPVESIDWTAVNNFVESKTPFYLDLGGLADMKILIYADCPTEQVWFYLEQIKGKAALESAKKDGKVLTIDKIKELAKKGDSLMWSDFDSYVYSEGGSGLYIRTYPVEDGYSLNIGGGSTTDKPMYIYLQGNGKTKIDIRYDSVDDFLTGTNKTETKAEETANGKKVLTIDDIKKLAKKGDDLTWSDFEDYNYSVIDSGLYIRLYGVAGAGEPCNFSITGTSLSEKPMHMYLTGTDKEIDIRYDNIDDFLAGTNKVETEAPAETVEIKTEVIEENSDSENVLTIEKIKELAKKGDKLTWSDFDGYDFEDVGSGIYIRVYNVKGGYTLAVGGGSLSKKPEYINLTDGGDSFIDIRYDNIDEFLKPFLHFDF